MEYNEIIIRLFESALAGAVGIIATSYYKDFKEKKDQQKFLFRRLLAAKGYLNIPQFVIDDLNTLEIIFQGKKKVIGKYHDYYAELCQSPDNIDFHKQKALYWDLLREMGNSVGYKNLDNKTLQGYYIPNEVVGNYLSQKTLYEARLEHYLKSAEMCKAFLDGKNGSQEDSKDPSRGEPKK